MDPRRGRIRLIFALEGDFFSEVSSLVFGKQMELHLFFVIFKF